MIYEMCPKCVYSLPGHVAIYTGNIALTIKQELRIRVQICIIVLVKDKSPIILSKFSS